MLSQKACTFLLASFFDLIDTTLATRLYEETPRFVDEYGLQTACSSAAATASLVYSQQRDMAELGPEYLSQRNAGRQYGNAYVEDDAALLRRAGLERGRFYGRSTYSTTYGGRGGRALSEGRSLAGPAGIGGMGVGSAGVGGASMAGSRDPRTLASPLAGGTDSPPYPVPRSTFSSMPGSPIPMGAGTSSIGTGVGGPAYGVGEASLLSPLGGVNPCSTVTPGTSPYPAAPGDPSYSNGAGGFVSTAGVPDVQPAGSSVTPGLTMNPTVNAAASMPLSAGAQASYPASNAPTGTVPQPLYGGASAAMPQAAYTNAGAPGTMPQTSYGGAPGVTSQAVHGSASLPVSRAMPGAMPQAADGGVLEPVSRGIPGATSQAGYGGASLPAPGAMPGALPGALPQAVYGGVPQPVSSGLPGAMPQAPYAGAPPPISGQAAYAGAQVYPPGSTIVLPSHKKRHRRRARSRDLEERDRYYRARRARDGYESH